MNRELELCKLPFGNVVDLLEVLEAPLLGLLDEEVDEDKGDDVEARE